MHCNLCFFFHARICVLRRNCDSGYVNGTAWEVVAAGTGKAPIAGRWHLITATYSGALGTPPYQEKVSFAS